jgi:two-component system, chemotaxis family, sensor kinase CheA
MSDEMDEIWALFADDGAQAMDAMETALLSLQGCDSADQPPLVAALFRAVHTFKGNSRVLGLETVESRAHLAEDLIGLVRDKGVALDEEILSLLLETGDRLREMLEETAQNRADVDPSNTASLVERLRDKIARSSGEHAGQDGPEPVITPEPVQDDAPQEDIPAAELEPEMPVTQVAQAAPAPPPAPQAPAPVAAPAKPAAQSGLAQDASYLAIFNEMVGDALKKLHTAQAKGDTASISRVLPGLAHAAKQLGLEMWQEALAALPKAPELAELPEVIQSIELLAGFTQPAPAEAPAQDNFFAQINEPLATVSRLGLNFSLGETPGAGILEQAITALCNAADAAGYVRVTAAARTLPAAGDAGAFRRSELRLYEELASVEMAIGTGDFHGGISPRQLLQNWCADHIFETLDELDSVLERFRKGSDGSSDHRALERLIRLVHYACSHFRLEVASDLAMSILDLFSRGHARGDRPDAILLQIARGFVDTLELVFDAMREGETPDITRLEALFREASEAGFSGAGAVTAGTIERRLGLPEAFHRVLSPESTRAASIAIEKGKSFFLLRADINSDDVLAEGLFDLIGSGQLEALTNVTVFDGDKTIFDFLLATDLDDVQLASRLAQLDPSGKKLVLQRKLNPAEGDQTAKAPEKPGYDATMDVIPSAELSSDVLNQLGEVAAGQAMLQSMLVDLSTTDLAETLDTVLRHNGTDMRAARQALRHVGEQLTDQLREIVQLGAQIMGHMSEMQQVTASLRTRPAETILRPLGAFVAAQARSNGFEATLTTSGNDEALDVTMLQSLRNALRHYLQSRLAQPVQAPRRLHFAIRKMDDQVQAVLEEDGSTPPSPDQIAAIEAEISPHGGVLRVIRRLEGGFRLHIFMPVSLVVLEGMVVGADGTRYVLPVSAIRSILQPDPTALVPITDLNGKSTWLRLNADELIPIREISAQHDGRSRKLAQDGKERVHVVVSLQDSCIAVPVDELLGQQLVVSRPLRGVMNGLDSISGVALLSRGDVAMVLSPASLCGHSRTDAAFAKSMAI